MTIHYHQINVCEMDHELEKIKMLSRNKKSVLIGLEITLKELSNKLTINIDPQHTWKKNNKITCLEKFKNLLPSVSKNISDKDLHFFFLKPDLDSISAAAIFDIYLDNPIWIFQEKILERINAIADYDRHGRDVDLNNNSSNIKIPRGLFMYVSGWQNNIYDKVNLTKTWIMDGTFKYINKFNKIVDKKNKQFLFNSKIEIIIPKKVVLIKSINRGACGLGYKYAPITIALNPSYRFGINKSRIYGKKWIIAQKNDGYLDMLGVLNNLQTLELNWGGSPTIIGSPQDKPSKVTKDEIVEIVTQKILVP